jgi:hypothetical protein
MRNSYLDVLKFLAIFTMIIDHIAYLLLPTDLIVVHHMRGIGRLAMPLFFAVHGYLLIKSTHPPNLTRISKFAFYGVLFSICMYIIPVDGTTHLMLNILLQFAIIESIHRITCSLRLPPLLLPVQFALIFSVLNITTDFEQLIDYGVYPLLYGLSGMMLAHSKQFMIQRLATVLLITALSFQYNPFLILLNVYYEEPSYIFFLLPSLCVPFLFWYIPKANDIDLPTLRPIIQLISCNAITIYVIHLQLLYIIHIAIY